LADENRQISNSTADVKHIDSCQYAVLSVACAAGMFKVYDVFLAETMIKLDGLRNFSVFKLYAFFKSRRWNEYSDKMRRYFKKNISSCIHVIIDTFYPCLLLQNHVNNMCFLIIDVSLAHDIPMCRDIAGFLDVCFTILLYNNIIYRNHIVLNV